MTDGDDRASGPGDGLSYEQARAELATVVERLEAGGNSLEESLALWERGERLAEICQGFLDGARERIDAVRQARETDRS
ncbi:exodeoxyribonuclease VII small subunit [Micromonospora sp. WMMD1102]|uniref:exodeoxyribonuclease VII small subunit n=1 Tax=Micromonospora sp. WMMD1102 TaxID=3016105 RepID=UPI00241535FD|nr:exodeoxyribonuclease VII small subunit [Micromonospora sp. WMMD1102]MDG4784555.1 exodeoxyribonuclease VII small subunit [Micromonospora sp. WMMD1102]